MRTYSIFGFIIAAVLVSSVIAVEEKKVTEKTVKKVHEFVGAKKCKTCHKQQFTAWSKTGHAKAFDLLTDEEKKNPECVGCHITGTTKKGVLLEGIQCEACHGGGKDYKSMKIMSKKKWKADPEAHRQKAIDAGLVYPTEETCLRCHNKKSPNFKKFDFEKRKKLVHPKPSKK